MAEEKKQEKQVKVSVIIPVYNDEEFLQECLGSVLGQSMHEIEVICVDDASTDSSLQILKSTAAVDDRLKIIQYKTNMSASQARKDAVLSSKGEYILFVDGDDLLNHRACEELYNEMKRDPVDILHFGTETINWSGVPDKRVLALQMQVAPIEEQRLVGKEVFEACFREKRYGFSLWNKMYEGNGCRRAMQYIEDGSFPKAQDKYAYFVISYFANSYRGIPEKYYTYRFGSGLTGHNCLDLTMFKVYCTMSKVADAIEAFICRENAYEYKDIVVDSRQQLLSDTIANWKRLRKKDSAKGFDMILKYWKRAEVVAALVNKNKYNQGEIAEKIKGSEEIKWDSQKASIKTIGVYYMRIFGGGAQRVTALLANIWQEMGYEIVLFTDMPETENDYYIAPGIKRVTLPAADGILQRNEYLKRAEKLENAVTEYKIDVMVYHAWASGILLWDMMVCKLAGAAFIVHCHSIFPVLMRNFFVYFARMTQVYQLCDGIVTLSDVDKCFWGNFNNHVYTTNNPLFFDWNSIKPSDLKRKNIVWVGRFSDEKHPMDAINIFKRIHDIDPEVRLYMLGEVSKETRTYCEKKLEELRIQTNVEICGYLNDVSPLLQQASLQLITSEYEGYSLALLEGMAYGIPCVMYELPYLTLVKDNGSISSVAYQDIDAAAEEALDILNDEIRRNTMGKLAREYVERFAKFDVAANWSNIFEKIFEDECEDVDSTEKIMFDTLLKFYEVGVLRANRKIKGAKKSLFRKVAFFGAGRRAKTLLKLYPDIRVELCIDNDKEKEGTSIEGIPVVHTDSITEWKKLFIIVTVVLSDEIKEQLEAMGLIYEEDFVLAKEILS